MGRQIEGDGQTFLTCSKVTAVKGIAVFGSRKARILTDGPRPLRVHGRIGAANIRRKAGVAIKMLKARNIIGRVSGFNVYTFRRGPSFACARDRLGRAKADFGKVRMAHDFAPLTLAVLKAELSLSSGCRVTPNIGSALSARALAAALMRALNGSILSIPPSASMC